MALVLQRRRVLRTIGILAAGGAGALVAGPAAALRVVASEDMQAVLDEGCGATAYHLRQIDEVVKSLGLSVTKEQRAQLLAGLTCPTCQCPLAAFDNPTGDLRF